MCGTGPVEEPCSFLTSSTTRGDLILIFFKVEEPISLVLMAICWSKRLPLPIMTFMIFWRQ